MSQWSQHDKDVIRTMWARGLQSSEIVPLLSVPKTRNAVMGMLNRLGLMGLGHATRDRIVAMDKVSDLMSETFSMGSPLHLESYLTLMMVRNFHDTVRDLSIASGVSLDQCDRYLERLPLVWDAARPVPERWQGGVEGNLAFILDMAVVKGSLSQTPCRPSSRVVCRSESDGSVSVRNGDVMMGLHAGDELIPVVGSGLAVRTQ